MRFDAIGFSLSCEVDYFVLHAHYVCNANALPEDTCTAITGCFNAHAAKKFFGIRRILTATSLQLKAVSGV